MPITINNGDEPQRKRPKSAPDVSFTVGEPLETLPIPGPSSEGKDEPYTVGYGKPPKAHQFKSGHSGNPRGRPKKAKNISTLVKEAFEEKVRVKIGGKYAKRSVMQLALRQLAAQAAKGDKRAIELALKLLGQYAPDETQDIDRPLSEDEIATFDSLIELQKRVHSKPDEEEAEPDSGGNHDGGNKDGDIVASDDDDEDDGP